MKTDNRILDTDNNKYSTCDMFFNWTKINGKCPKCGKESVERNDSIILTSLPPQHQYRCTACNYAWSAHNDDEAVGSESHRGINDNCIADSSILNGPQVGDVPSYGFGWGREGWVCPKCGRVYSPYTSMCPYCGGGNDNYVFTCDTKPLKYEPITVSKDGSLNSTNSSIADRCNISPHI